MNTKSLLRRPTWIAGFLLASALAIPASLVRAEDAPAEPKPPEDAKPAEPKPPEDAKPADAPKPEAGPKSTAGRRWMLGFTHGTLKRVLVDDGTGRETTYLYMTMTVENATGQNRPWRPTVTGKVDTRPEPYIAGGYAPALARIRSQEGKPDLQPIEATGWKKGEEGLIASGAKLNLVAIFGAVDPGWASFHIEVQGLVNAVTTLKVAKYGEKQIVMEAAYAARNAKVMEELKAAAKASGSDLPRPTAEYQEVREKRVFSIDYKRSGDEFRPDDDLIEFVSEGWEVIGVPKIIRTIPSSS